jgi:hypothetical protein
MKRSEIQFDQRVFVRGERRESVVRNVHHPVNPNLRAFEALIDFDKNAIGWINIDELEPAS